VTGSAGDYKVYQLTNQFEHSFIPGLIATEYAFGVWVPEGGTDECEFVIEDVVLYQNTSAVDIVGLETGMWLDFDISSGGTGDLADTNSKYNSIWMWDVAVPTAVFGMTMITADTVKKPGCCVVWCWNDINKKDTTYICETGITQDSCKKIAKNKDQQQGRDCKVREFREDGDGYKCETWTVGGRTWDTCIAKTDKIYMPTSMTGYGFSQALRVYDGQYVDSLKYWMENLGWGIDNPTTPEDKSIIIANAGVDIPAGGSLMNKWLKWGYVAAIGTGGDADWRHFLYNILHQQGFYRGDVNKSGKLDVTDVIYTINYLFKGGPSPIEFADQGDVNNSTKTDVTDVIYMINYLFKGGPVPIDKNRWLDKSPFVDAAYKASAVRVPGLFGDDDWKGLGQ
jgi:hypothetical protein